MTKPRRLTDCETVTELAAAVHLKLKRIKEGLEVDADIVSAEIHEAIDRMEDLSVRLQELERSHHALCVRVDRMQGIK